MGDSRLYAMSRGRLLLISQSNDLGRGLGGIGIGISVHLENIKRK